MATSCGYEFQLRHFRFESADESNFYESQWTTCKTVFVIYRTVLLLFHWGWLIAGWVLAKPDHYYTLTNWSVFFTGLYFLFAFVTSIYGITIKKDYSGPKTDPTLVTNQPSTTSGISKQGKLNILHQVTWFLHVVATTYALYVVPVYWVAVAPSQTAEKRSMPISVYKHAVQLALLLIDFFVAAIPTRWVHVVYSQLMAFAYAIMVVIVHFAGVNSRVYGFLDFEKSAGTAVGILFAATLLAPVILHSIYFGLYHLRMLIHRSTANGREPDAATGSSRAAVSHDNQAFSL